MNNTVPEARVNKNGVSVIKHVRPTPKTKAGTSAMPAPSVSGAAKATSKPKTVKAPKVPSGQDIIDAFQKRDQELFGPPAGRVVTFGYESPYMDKFPPQLRHDIVDFIAKAEKQDIRVLKDLISHDYERPTKFAMHVKVLPFARKLSALGEFSYNAPDDLDKIYSALKMYEFKGDFTDYHVGVFKAEYLAQGVGIRLSAAGIPHEYYAKIEAIRTNMEAIEPAVPMIMAAAQKYSYDGLSIEKIMEVTEFASKYPEHIDRLAEVIKVRQEFDSEMLDDLMLNGSIALSDGIL